MTLLFTFNLNNYHFKKKTTKTNIVYESDINKNKH